jgi:hypothetical protein
LSIDPSRIAAVYEIPDCGCKYVLPCNCPKQVISEPGRRKVTLPCDCPVHIARPCSHVLESDFQFRCRKCGWRPTGLKLRDLYEYGDQGEVVGILLVACPDCDAPVAEGLSFEEWREFLWHYREPDYADPPPPAAAMIVLKREARVEVLRNRAAIDEWQALCPSCPWHSAVLPKKRLHRHRHCPRCGAQARHEPLPRHHLWHDEDLRPEHAVVDCLRRLVGMTDNWRPVQLGLEVMTQSRPKVKVELPTKVDDRWAGLPPTIPDEITGPERKALLRKQWFGEAR